MEKSTQDRLKHLEDLLEWLLSIPNEFNRARLFKDRQIVTLIEEKLKIMESEYD
jgi:hypothetical protein